MRAGERPPASTAAGCGGSSWGCPCAERATRIIGDHGRRGDCRGEGHVAGSDRIEWLIRIAAGLPLRVSTTRSC
jgi:hypothetical protein